MGFGEELRPGTWVVDQQASMHPAAVVQLLRGFTDRRGAATVAVAVRGSGVDPQQYADLAAELARWPGGASVRAHAPACLCGQAWLCSCRTPAP
jgi:hypothetical protein